MPSSASVTSYPAALSVDPILSQTASSPSTTKIPCLARFATGSTFFSLRNKFSIVQDYIQQGVVNNQLVPVFDESQFAKAVHEETDPRTGCADHLRQGLLADFGEDRLRRAVFAELREHQQRPSQPLFAGIEKMVHQVRLHPA